MAVGYNDICEHGNVVSQCDVCYDLPDRLKAAEEKKKLDAIQAERIRIEKEKAGKERVGNIQCFFKDCPENFKPKLKKIWTKDLLIFRKESLRDALDRAKMYLAMEYPEANALVETTIQTLVLTEVSGGGGGGGGSYGVSSVSVEPVTSQTDLLIEIRGFPAFVDEKYISARFEQESS